jgi:hypothetical protein
MRAVMDIAVPRPNSGDRMMSGGQPGTPQKAATGPLAGWHGL